MNVTRLFLAQALARLSPRLVATLLGVALVAVALAVTLVVASGVGPHLMHAVASHFQVPSFGIHPYPSDPCPGGNGTSC